MATWGEFAAADPEMAAHGLKLLQQFGDRNTGLAYLATTRKDGSPRVHPVCPFIGEGRLFVATNHTSPKRLDLLRDGRYVIHMLPGKNDAEFLIRGRATFIPEGPDRELAVRAGAAAIQSSGIGVQVKPEEWVFEYDIEEAMSAYWEKVGQPGTYPVRKKWKAPR